MEERKMVTRVKELDGGYSGDLPSKLSEYSKLFEDIITEIPEQYREVATVDFEIEDDDIRWSVQYIEIRPETDEEMRLRLKYAAADRQRDLAKLAELKAKYPEAA
jgi:hypothetical protein